MHQFVIDTPIGWIRLIADESALVAIEKATAKAGPKTTNHPILKQAQQQLVEYFLGKRMSFDLSLVPATTLFQQKVRAALQKIPYGATLTYGEVAKVVGTKSARAVGQAVGANPLLIIVPCHRVVAGSGLGGFAWGLRAKKQLLGHEVA